ncbi:MAG: SOS response-associated peptidase [Christensenellaceae bacterium]|nr:SOS response-associated peptidase [Christensenellaceae bacterium]
MCGRFWIPEADGPEELLALLNRAELARRVRHPDFVLKRGEICPGDNAAVLAPNRNRQTSLFIMRWGFRLEKRLVFNARSETASSRAMFRESLRDRRCVIPAASFFEWDHRLKKPAKFRFWPEGRPMMYLAGLYRFEPDAPLPVFTVLTRPAEGVIADFHDRMPVILREEQLDLWLDQGLNPQFFFDEQPPSLASQPDD